MSENVLGNLHILVIDDEVFMRKLVQRVLTALGVLTISQAENGREGLTALETSDQKIDVVLCDLGMPEMDGFAFVKHVREHDASQYDPTIPIIILTGASDAETTQEAESLGINGYLVKPVAKQPLEDKIMKAVAS